MLIIDGDLYVYKAGFAFKGKEVGFKLVHRSNTQEIDLGNISLTKAKERCKQEGYKREEWRLTYYNNPFPLDFVLGHLDNAIEDLLNKFNLPEYKMFITSSDYSNYRYKIATITPYKGSRRKCIKCYDKCKAEYDKDKNVILICKNCGEVEHDTTVADKPHYYNEIRDHLVKRWNAELVHGQEADDAAGIEYMKHFDNYFFKGLYPVTLVHIDKDINNIPGEHYNPDTDKLYNVSIKDAERNFYSQFLLGDSIDCIPGVYGIGKVLCQEILKDCDTKQDYENRIMDIYQGEYSIKKFTNKMCLTPQQAYDRLTEIGQLLWIRQEENELWKPMICSP